MGVIDFNQLELHIASQIWGSADVQSFSLIDGVARINDQVVGQQNKYVDAANLLALLKTGFAAGFQAQEFSTLHLRVEPARLGLKTLKLLEIAANPKANPKTSAEFAALRARSRFEVLPVEVFLNHQPWVISLPAKDFLPRLDNFQTFLHVRIDSEQNQAVEFWWAIDPTVGDYFFQIQAAELIKWRPARASENEYSTKFSEFREFIETALPELGQTYGDYSLIDAIVMQALQDETSAATAKSQNLILLNRVRTSLKHQVQKRKTIHRALEQSKVWDVQLSAKVVGVIAEHLVAPLAEAFEAILVEFDSPIKSNAVMLATAVRSKKLVVDLDPVFGRIGRKVNAHRSLTLAEKREQIENEIQLVRQKSDDQAELFSELTEQLGVRPRNFAHVCQLIEELAEYAPQSLIDQIWLKAYEIRDSPNRQVRLLQLEVEAFERETSKAAEVCKKLQWPDDWPPLLAAVWKEAGGRKGSALPWKNAGWSPAEVLTLRAIPVTEKLSLAARLNLKNPPQRAIAIIHMQYLDEILGEENIS